MKVISIYEFTDYKKFFLAWIKNQPQKGRGLLSQLAERLGTSSASISQIFSDDRHLNLEHTVEAAEMIHLNEDETYYFILLVEWGRAGSAKLQKKLLAKIKSEQARQQKLVNRLAKDAVLTEEVKSVFYSSWVYTGAMNLIALEQIKNLEELSAHLRIDKSRVQKIIQFLLDHHLLINENGQLKTGPQKTHLENSSPWVIKHHHNWRIKSMEAMQNYDETDLFYSAPMSLSAEVAHQVRQQLPEFIKQIVDQVGPSKSELVRCLNIDWFQY